MSISIDRTPWIKEGFLLQISKDQYFLGQGPFRFSNHPCLGLYFPDFFLKAKRPWFQPQKSRLLNKKELLNFLNLDSLSSSKILTQKIKPASFLEFQETFYQIQNQIRSSSIQKIVPVFFEEIEAQVNAEVFLKNFFSQNLVRSNQGYLYGCWNQEKGVIGFSPEILFSFKERDFYTMALAGTAPFPGPSLLKDKKERKEHEYVIRSIKSSGIGELDWQEGITHEKRFGSIKHLCTYQRATLSKTVDYLKFVHALHPTAALCSYPKSEGLAWLAKHKTQHKRSSFGAPIGYFNGRDQGFCLVAIRNIEWKHNRLKIPAGAGIIKDSILQKEWRELFLKREQVKRIFL